MEGMYLCKAKRIDNGEWVEGYYVKHVNTCVCFSGDLKFENIHHWILLDGFCDWGLEPPLMRADIDPATICRCTGKKDMHGKEVYERDLIESQTCGLVMEIRFGIYQAYCPADRCDMDSVGFYAVAKGYQEMPIGPLEDYAVVVGNIYDNSELMDSDN